MLSENEIKKIIKETLSDGLRKHSTPKRKITRILEIFITPFVITVVSLIATYTINQNQAKNARVIAEAQIESAKEIAKSEMDQSSRIANAEREVQQLIQIKEVFNNIIQNAQKDPNSIKVQIASLAVYEETALPFLARIRDHFNSVYNESKLEKINELSKYAEETIDVVLSGEQLDFTGMKFSGPGTEKRNLRFANFINYNLTKACFDNCNLFNSKFNNSTLTETSFKNSDLHGANFLETKLDYADFSGANVRNAVFLKCKLDGAKFSNAEHLEDANFSLGSLLKIYNEDKKLKAPFANVKDDTMLNLLAKHHIQEIKEINPNDERIIELLKKFEHIVMFENLIKDLEERKKEFNLR